MKDEFKEEFKNAFVVEFPLRGEWNSPNTPGKKIPSHGTEQFGQKYAFDFWKVDWKKSNTKFYEGSEFKYYFRGIPLNKCYGYGKEVYAPCDGKIVRLEDGFKERHNVNIVSDIFAVLKNSITFNSEKTGVQPIAGNYIIMECAKNTFAFFAHFQKESITVELGEEIKKGQVIGKVGHSGNSTAPHLHFHIMDNMDFFKAKGIPCIFEKYELFKEGHWQEIRNDLPSDKDIIRFNGE